MNVNLIFKLRSYEVYLTSKFIEMGGLVHFFLSLVVRSSISAFKEHSFIPAILFILKNK